jgi:hypothetical protein
MRFPRLIVPCRSLGEYRSRANKVAVPGVKHHSADFGLTPLVLGDGPELRAGFHHASRTVLGIEAGLGWLAQLPATTSYTISGEQLMPDQLYAIWYAELEREQELAKSKAQTRQEAEEVLLTACFGVTAAADDFADIAREVVAGSEGYREGRRRERQAD